MHLSLVFSFSLLVLILPLGLDTLGVSLSLGMKSAARPDASAQTPQRSLPPWLRTALLFALAETLMPIIGLVIGAALSSLMSGIMHYVGAMVLIGLGAWELIEESREYLHKRQKRGQNAPIQETISRPPRTVPERFLWGQQLLLALSISLDELAVGFSFGSLKSVTLSPMLLCVLVGLQGFLMTLLGLTLGRALRRRLKTFKEVSELLSAALLIGLGIWFLFA